MLVHRIVQTEGMDSVDVWWSEGPKFRPNILETSYRSWAQQTMLKLQKSWAEAWLSNMVWQTSDAWGIISSPRGILAHLLRMVMEPKYHAFRFGDYTPQSSSENMTIDA